MLKLILQCAIFFLVLPFWLQAQAPQGFTYQAVVRNTAGELIELSPVGVKLSIQQGSENGITVYSETHSLTTNANGLMSMAIGSGTSLSGSFSGIDWASGPFFLKTETDPNGGSNYSIESTTQLMSVPYALYANQTGSSLPGPQGDQGPAGPPGPQGAQGAAGTSICETLGEGRLAVVYGATSAYGISQGQSTLNNNYTAPDYEFQSLSGTVLGSAASEYQIVVYTTTGAYAYYQTQSSVSTNWNTGTWLFQSLSGTPLGAVASKQNIVVYTTTGAYGLSQNQSSSGNPPNWSTATWLFQSISGTVVGTKVTARSVILYTTTGIYTFAQTQSTFGDPPVENTGVWYFQSMSEPPLDGVISR